MASGKQALGGLVVLALLANVGVSVVYGQQQEGDTSTKRTGDAIDSLEQALGSLEGTVDSAARVPHGDEIATADTAALGTSAQYDDGKLGLKAVTENAVAYPYPLTVIGVDRAIVVPGQKIHVTVRHSQRERKFKPGVAQGVVWCSFGDVADQHWSTALKSKPPFKPGRIHPESYHAAWIECKVPDDMPSSSAPIQVKVSVDRDIWYCQQNCELEVQPRNTLMPHNVKTYHDEDNTKIRVQWNNPIDNKFNIKFENWRLYQRVAFEGDGIRPRPWKLVDTTKRDRDECHENWCTESDKSRYMWYLAEGLHPDTLYQWKLEAQVPVPQGGVPVAKIGKNTPHFITPAYVTTPVTPATVFAPACKFGPWVDHKSGCDQPCGPGKIQQQRHITQRPSMSEYVPTSFGKPICFRQTRKVPCNRGPCVCHQLELQVKGWEGVALPPPAAKTATLVYNTPNTRNRQNAPLSEKQAILSRQCFPVFEPEVWCRPAKMSTGIDEVTNGPKRPEPGKNYCLADFGPRIRAATSAARARVPFKGPGKVRLPKPLLGKPKKWEDIDYSDFHQDWYGDEMVCDRSKQMDTVLGLAHFLESTQQSGTSRGGAIQSIIAQPKFIMTGKHLSPKQAKSPHIAPFKLTFDHTHGRQSVQCEIWDYASGRSMGTFRVNPFDMEGADREGFVKVPVKKNPAPTAPQLAVDVSPSLKWSMGVTQADANAIVNLKCVDQKPRERPQFSRQPRGWTPGTHGGCPMVIAHRAVSFQEGQENSLRALEETNQAGFDGVEIDVFLVKRSTLNLEQTMDKIMRDTKEKYKDVLNRRYGNKAKAGTDKDPSDASRSIKDTNTATAEGTATPDTSAGAGTTESGTEGSEGTDVDTTATTAGSEEDILTQATSTGPNRNGLGAPKKLIGEYELVISHDDDLYRLMDIEGTLTTAAKRGALDFLRKKTQCPLLFPLRDYLEVAKKHGLYLDIELKPGDYRKDPVLDGLRGDYATELGRRAGSLIRRMGMEKNVIVSSFDAKKLRAVNKGFKTPIRTCIATHSGVMTVLGKALRASKKRDYGAEALHFPLVTKKKVERLHARGMSVGVYTIYDMEAPSSDDSYKESTIKKLVDAKVDFIETDDPPRLRRVLDRLCGRGDTETHSKQTTEK
eukprot:TRINITY_DN453_c0_g2_i4.p1 TRINITY_DN453_c0_g2~~TRINITY_DN453_c0_g2_i4.p1  ORF type:complete len:1140 (+),score=270.00 TRINITY_DN453_c0_g2_i4:107-3526(+)